MNLFLNLLLVVLITLCLTGSFFVGMWIVNKYAARDGWVGEFCLAGAVLATLVLGFTSVISVVYLFTPIMR